MSEPNPIDFAEFCASENKKKGAPLLDLIKRARQYVPFSDFLNSCETQVLEKHFLTRKQIGAIEGIIRGGQFDQLEDSIEDAYPGAFDYGYDEAHEFDRGDFC